MPVSGFRLGALEVRDIVTALLDSRSCSGRHISVAHSAACGNICTSLKW